MARICLIRQFYYPLDIRVRREVEALLAAGHEVDVICVRRPGEPAHERQGRLTVRRLAVKHRRGGAAEYLLQYGHFMALAAAIAGWRHLRRRYDVVQANSMPDALVFAAIIPKLLGARVLLDLHESMPEFFATKFKVSPRHPGVRLMAALEQAAIRFADSAVTCTEQQRQRFIERGAHPRTVSVILNAADESIFDAARFPHRGRQPDRFVLICHGSVEERYGLDTIIRAVALLADEIPGLRFEVYGEGTYRDELHRLTGALGVQQNVWFSDGFVPMDALLRAIAEADAGVVAMKRDAFRDLTHCNKMYDFIAMGLPVICSRTGSVEAYFPDSAFAYFTSDDPADLARAIREVWAAPDHAARLVAEAQRVNEPYRWPHQRAKYLRIVDRLVARSPRIGRERSGAGQTAARRTHHAPRIANSELRTPN